MDNSSYYTGGLFGCLLAVDNRHTNNLYNLTGWNTSLSGPSNNTLDEYIGTFAGMVPAPETWSGNYSNKGIYLKNFDGIPEIGGTR